MQHIGFKLNDKEYSIPIHRVREVIKTPSSVTKLPLVPSYVEGVANLRGKVIPLVNLKKLAGLETVSNGDMVMVVGGEGVKFGFYVDSVTGVLTVDQAGMQPEYGDASGAFERSIQVGNRVVRPVDAKELIPKQDIAARDANGGNIFLDR